MATVEITPPPLSAQSMADLLCTIMILIQGMQPNGKPFWAYMRVKPSMAKPFREAREKGNFNLEDFGTIIEWGEQETVPADIRDRMAREYSANHDYEAQLLEALKAKQSS